jgi:gliding-associated putative ABC transporter substrate-binding component GldG
MWAIGKKEWAQYFSGITGYLIIGFYLLVNGLVLFVLPNYNVLDFGYASLQVYFDYAPWFLIFLIPAITMHSFSDEYKLGTYELIRSLPIRPWQLVLGKFLGAYLIVLVAIAPTFMYAVILDNLSTLGGLDWGGTIGSYLGLLFLAAAFTAIGIYTSSSSKNNLVALLYAILLSLILYKGFDWISGYTIFKNGFDFYLIQLGFSNHYRSISKGVLSFQDVIYFISILLLFILGSLENIKAKFKYLATITFILVFNYLAFVWPLQLDLTKEHRYTLSTSTKQIIQGVRKSVKIHLYLGGDLPAYYKKIAQASSGLLESLHQMNPKFIQWQLDLPSQIYKDTALYQLYDSLSKLGLPIQRLQDQSASSDKRVDQLLIPGALIEVEGQKPMVIDLRSSKKFFKPYNIVKDIPEEDLEASANAAEALLDYKFTQAIYLLNRIEVPTIAYAIGNGEPINLTVNDLGESIRHQYNLVVFDLKKGYPDAKKIKTIIIVKPTQPFTEIDKLKLDQYLMSGGNILWAVDKLYAEYDSLKKTEGSYVAYDRGLSLDDLFFKYGIRMNSNLVQDLNCAKLPMVVGKQADGSPMIQRIPWPYYPFLLGEDRHPLVQNLDRVLSLFPSSIDTLVNANIKKTILLSTDSTSRIIATPNLVSLNSVKEEADMASFTQVHLPIAVLLEGKFSSLYANRIPTALKDSIFKTTGQAYQALASVNAKQIVIADADIFTNQLDKTRGPMPMGMIPFEDYQFANHDFYMNCMAYLNEPTSLLESRNKFVILRLLNKQKVEENRLFWQLLIITSPFLFLTIGFLVWTNYRKRRFAL